MLLGLADYFCWILRLPLTFVGIVESLSISSHVFISSKVLHCMCSLHSEFQTIICRDENSSRTASNTATPILPTHQSLNAKVAFVCHPKLASYLSFPLCSCLFCHFSFSMYQWWNLVCLKIWIPNLTIFTFNCTYNEAGMPNIMFSVFARLTFY